MLVVGGATLAGSRLIRPILSGRRVCAFPVFRRWNRVRSADMDKWVVPGMISEGILFIYRTSSSEKVVIPESGMLGLKNLRSESLFSDSAAISCNTTGRREHTSG